MSKLYSTLKKGIETILNLSNFSALEKSKKRKICLMLSPQYLNYGDHAIALSELEYFKETFSDYDVMDINYSMIKYWFKRVKSCINANDIIVITGGGFMGDLWEENECLTEKIFCEFPENRIVVFPQTIFFKEGANSINAQRLKQILDKHNNFYIFARDYSTTQLLSKMGYTNGKHFSLVPDFVLFLKNRQISAKPHHYPSICIRKDGEGVLNDKTKEQINQIKAEKFDMAVNHVEIPTYLRSIFLERKLKQFVSAEYVITDRLHAMILSAYTGTPCIAFDNISKKVSGVYKWINSLDYIVVAEQTDDINELIKTVKSFPDKFQNRDKYFIAQKRLSDQYLSEVEAVIRKGE